MRFRGVSEEDSRYYGNVDCRGPVAAPGVDLSSYLQRVRFMDIPPPLTVETSSH